MKPTKSFGERLGSLKSQTLYLLLIAFATIPLFIKLDVPNKPDESATDLFVNLMTAPLDRPILIETDWTNSTRGESSGHFEALLRIVTRRGLKFVMYSGADPQAPQVARNVLRRINDERKEKGLPLYQPWVDYLDLGYFPNLEGFSNAMASNIRTAWAGQQAAMPTGQMADIFKSDILKNVRKIGDFSYLVNITASGTIDILVERLYGKVPLMLMCTGVMGPQAVPYYSNQPRQLAGLAVGLKGVYDLETMMQVGVRGPQVAAEGRIGRVVSDNFPDADIPGFDPAKYGKNYDRAAAYYPALHSALTLMILAVIAGNVGLVVSRRGGRA